MKPNRIKKFSVFYPFYLQQHSNNTNRLLHFIGTVLLILTLISAIIFKKYNLLWLMPLVGYGFAWVGHFFIEKNKPATFEYPIYSLMGDFKMFWQILTGKLKLRS